MSFSLGSEMWLIDVAKLDRAINGGNTQNLGKKRGLFGDVMGGNSLFWVFLVKKCRIECNRWLKLP